MSDEENSQKGSEAENEEEKEKVWPILGPKVDEDSLKANVLQIFKECLSDIELTADGNGMAFTQLVIDKEGIKNLYDLLGSYPHLRNLNIMGNEITDIHSLTLLPYLLKCDASRNLIVELQCLYEPSKLEYL